jgi:hypothetical protein
MMDGDRNNRKITKVKGGNKERKGRKLLQTS